MTRALKVTATKPPLAAKLPVKLPARIRNRRRVLRAARALVMQHGLEALTMRRLAAEAEVSVATLYNLIGGRDDVVRALGLVFLEELDEAYANLTTSDPLKRAREMFTMVIEAVVKELPPALLLALLADTLQHSELIPNWQPHVALADAMEEMVTAGLLGNDLSVQFISRQVWWAQMSHMRQWAMGRLDAHELRAAVLHCLDLHLLAVATPAARGRFLEHARSLERELHHL